MRTPNAHEFVNSTLWVALPWGATFGVLFNQDGYAYKAGIFGRHTLGMEGPEVVEHYKAKGAVIMVQYGNVGRWRLIVGEYRQRRMFP